MFLKPKQLKVLSLCPFFKEKIPNFDALVENAMGQFKDIYVGAASNN
jgi:hypothetical protein